MRPIARVSLETMLLSVATRGIAMIGAVVIARTLGPASKGLLTYAQSMLALVATFVAGQTAAIAFQYGRRGLAKATVYRTMLVILGLIIVPVAVIMAIVALRVPGQWPLLAAAAALPLAAHNQSARGFFLADSEIRTANIQALIAPSLFTVFGSIALLGFHASLNTVLVIFVLSYVPAVGYSIAKLSKLSSARKPEAERRPLLAQILFTVQVGSVNLVNFINNRIDLFIILFVLGVKALGIYSVAVGIAEILWQLSGPVAVAAYGSIGTLTESDAARLTARCIRNTLPLALVVSLFTFVLAPPLVSLVFGPRFAEAGYVTRYFLPGVIAWSAMYHVNTFITQQLGQPRMVLAMVAASAVVCAVTTFALVHKLGIASGAIGSSLGYLTGAPWAIAIFLRRSKLPIRELVAFSKDDWRRYVELFMWVRRGAAAVLAR